MNQHKRQLSYDNVLNEGIKKIQYELDQKNISITSIENLSNEFFYEVFDYLDGHYIYEAFHNLNHRFQQLLNSSFILFKIKIRSYDKVYFINDCKEINHFNRNQILSIYMQIPFYMNEFSLPITIDSSLTRLESLVIINMESNIFLSLIIKLNCLPRLFSLTIEINNNEKNLTNIYKQIFSLPVLKYYRYSIRNFDRSLILPIANNKQSSSIEKLIIDHHCNIEQLANIISYTPKLIHLSFKYLDDSITNNIILMPITLRNLTHLYLCTSRITFNEFNFLINDIYSKVKVLSFSTESEDINYLNSNRWEKLILKKFPQLEKFYFKCSNDIDYENEFLKYFYKGGEFLSSFWIERQWLLEVVLYDTNINFYIRPYKKQWYQYEIQHKIDDYYTQLDKSSRLTINSIFNNENLITDISRILIFVQIYHCEIKLYDISIGSLTLIINSLRELRSLKIDSLSSCQSECMNNGELVPIYSTLYTNKLKKVYLSNLNGIEDFHMILKSCPYMEYFEVEYIYVNIIEEFLQIILNKINHDHNDHFRLLCLHIFIFDDDDYNNTYGDKLIKKFQTIINSNNILDNYTIKRIADNIYLEWK